MSTTTSSPSTNVIPGKEKVIKELRAAAKTADRILLAADPDREGEAICQHLKEILDGNKAEVFRVLFNEITPKAIRAAIEKPGRINQHIVDAQQARRILDRLVGYQISPLLWDKVRRGISAGRVQTVALRMIVEREREISGVHTGRILVHHRKARRASAAAVRCAAREDQGQDR